MTRLTWSVPENHVQLNYFRVEIQEMLLNKNLVVVRVPGNQDKWDQSNASLIGRLKARLYAQCQEPVCH